MSSLPFGQGLFGQNLFGFDPATNTTLGIAFGSGPGSLAYRILRLAGYIWTGVVPEPEMVQDCLDECNSFLDGMDAQQMDQQFIDDRYFDITTSQQSYTLGPTGDFNTDANGNPLLYRPQRIVRANLILQNNVVEPTRIPIQIIDVDDFADIPVIDITSQVVIRIYVQTTFNNVTLWCFPFPTAGNQFEFFMWPGVAKFASVDAFLLNANPGFLDYLVFGMAERMYMYLPKDKGVLARNRGQWLHSMAVQSKRTFEASNAPTPKMTPDLSTETGSDSGAPFNYLYGDFSQ